MDIGSVIRDARTQAGLSQLALGIAIGNDSSYISKIENGQKEPNVKTIIKIANALNVDPVELFKKICERE